MSVPQGFYELHTAPEADANWPVFLRVVPVRESVELAYCEPGANRPCGKEEWLHYRPASVIYVGPIARWQVPMALAITRVAVDHSWPLEPICSTWGSSRESCKTDRWLLPYEVAPIAPYELFPWPYQQARWTVIKEQHAPLAHQIVASAPPSLFTLQPVAMREP